MGSEGEKSPLLTLFTATQIQLDAFTPSSMMFSLKVSNAFLSVSLFELLVVTHELCQLLSSQ